MRTERRTLVARPGTPSPALVLRALPVLVVQRMLCRLVRQCVLVVCVRLCGILRLGPDASC